MAGEMEWQWCIKVTSYLLEMLCSSLWLLNDSTWCWLTDTGWDCCWPPCCPVVSLPELCAVVLHMKLTSPQQSVLDDFSVTFQDAADKTAQNFMASMELCLFTHQVGSTFDWVFCLDQTVIWKWGVCLLLHCHCHITIWWALDLLVHLSSR